MGEIDASSFDESLYHFVSWGRNDRTDHVSLNVVICPVEMRTIRDAIRDGVPIHYPLVYELAHGLSSDYAAYEHLYESKVAHTMRDFPPDVSGHVFDPCPGADTIIYDPRPWQVKCVLGHWHPVSVIATRVLPGVWLLMYHDHDTSRPVTDEYWWDADTRTFTRMSSRNNRVCDVFVSHSVLRTRTDALRRRELDPRRVPQRVPRKFGQQHMNHSFKTAHR